MQGLEECLGVTVHLEPLHERRGEGARVVHGYRGAERLVQAINDHAELMGNSCKRPS